MRRVRTSQNEGGWGLNYRVIARISGELGLDYRDVMEVIGGYWHGIRAWIMSRDIWMRYVRGGAEWRREKGEYDIEIEGIGEMRCKSVGNVWKPLNEGWYYRARAWKRAKMIEWAMKGRRKRTRIYEKVQESKADVHEGSDDGGSL